MGTRIELQKLLEEILGSRNVYFQPPENLKMSYPAIVYTHNGIDNVYADDSVYIQSLEYQITVIDKNPDGDIWLKVSKLPGCRHDRNFKSDNLNHYVFTLTF